MSTIIESSDLETTGPTVAQLRHRAEVPTLVVAGLLTALGVIVAIAAAGSDLSTPAWATAALVGLATPILAGVVFIRFLYWKNIADGVEITEHQLPEVHARYRCGAYYAPEGAKSMMVLFAGKRMYRHCSIDAYRASIGNHKDGFWLKVANLLSDHAVGWRRMQPLADIATRGWDQHGKML